MAPENRPRRRHASGGFGIHCARPLWDAWDRRVLARRRDRLLSWRTVDVGEAHLLHGVQVIQVTPILLEAVGGRRGCGVIAQVVLAELAGRVAEVAQEDSKC